MLWNSGQLPENWTLEKLRGKHPSNPHNPLIANAFFRAGYIEVWGRGIEKIERECREHGIESPEYDYGMSGLMLTFRANPAQLARGLRTAPNGTKLALSRHQVQILEKCRNPAGITELMTLVGRSDRTKFRQQVLNPLLEAGLIEMTVPDKPQSSRQKYQLAPKGRLYLAQSRVQKGEP